MSETGSRRRGATGVKRICLVGATGMAGSAVIDAAVGRPDVRVVAVTRREIALPPGARMEVIVADPDEWSRAIAASGADVLVCALGTTMRKADGDEDAFRAVDCDLVVETATAAKQAGIDHVIVVSSAGSDYASTNFYLRTKGEMEVALRKVGLRRLDILRPGLLLGKRRESRPLERMAMMFNPVLNLLLRGTRRKYRSIRAQTLARVIFVLAHKRAGGRFTHDFDAMNFALKQAGDYSDLAHAA